MGRTPARQARRTAAVHRETGSSRAVWDQLDRFRCTLRPAQRITHRIIRLGLCRTTAVQETPSPIDLSSLANRFNVSSSVVEDLYARRRAGARDAELINLLQQQDRGGLDPERARALVAELPAR